MNKRLLKGSVLFAMAVVLSSVACFILAFYNVFDVSPFLLCITVLSYGLGLVFTVYGFIGKGGYETAVGVILLGIGLIFNLILLKINVAIIILVAFAFYFFSILSAVFFFADRLSVKRAKDEENYKSFDDARKEKLEKRAEEDAKPLPKLKDYSKKD